MPGKESDSRGGAHGANGHGKPSGDADASLDWDSSRDSPQDWNRGESMRSGSGRSLASLGSKAETNSVAESTSSGVEVAKEAKEKKDKSSWVKTIGMRTLRLRKNKDPEKSQSRLSISSALGSLERSSKGKNKTKSAEKHAKGENEQRHEAGAATSSGTSNKAGEHVKDNDSIYSGASSKNGSIAKVAVGGSNSTNPPAGENADKQDPARFLGEGLLFKGKLIGVLEVSGPRGDRICQEALSELKMAVKAAGEHKQKITIHIALDGLRIRDEKTGDCLYHHQVHKISFIAQDLTDSRAFGYIFGSPDTGHRFFGIKTEKSASQVVIAMRDLFQTVFDLKKKEIERAKQQLEMQQKFLATRAAETAPTTKTEPKFSIAETYIEGAGAVGGVTSGSDTNNPSAPEVDLLNLEVELNSLQEGLDNIHTNLVDSVPFRGSTASISSDPMNPMPKLSTGSLASASNASNPTPVSSSALGGDPFGDSFDPFDGGAAAHSTAPAPTFTSSSSLRYHLKSGLSESSPLSLLANSQHPLGQSQSSPYSNSTTPLTFTADPFAQVDPFPGPKYGEADFFNSDPFDSPSGQFSFAYPSSEPVTKLSTMGNSTAAEKVDDDANEAVQPNNKPVNEPEKENSASVKSTFKEKHADGWVASFDFEDNFVPESEANDQDDPSKIELDIFTELDPLGTGRIRPFVDRKDFFQKEKQLRNPPKKNLKDLGAPKNITPHSSSSSLVAENSVVNTSMSGLNAHNISSNSNNNETSLPPPKVHLTDISSIPNSFSTNFTSSQINEAVETLPLKTPPTSASSRSSSIRMRLHSENSRSDSPPNYSPPPPPHVMHFSSTSSIGSVGGMGITNSEYMATPGSQLPFLPPPSSILGTPPSSRFANKKSPQLLKQMTIAGSSANTAMSSPKTLPRPSSGGRERKLTAESHSSAGTNDEIPNLTPPPRPPHSHASNTLGKSVSLSTAVPRPSSGSERLRNLSGLSSLSGLSTGTLPPEPPPRPLQTTTISSGLSQQMSPSLVSPPPPLPPKKQAFSSMQSSPLNLFPASKQQSSLTDFGKSGLSKGASESNDLPLPLPSRKPHASSSSHATAGGRYSVPLPSMSPSVQRREVDSERDRHHHHHRHHPKLASANSHSGSGGGRHPVVKLSMEQALHQVASMSLGDLANKLELPVEKLSSLTIQQLAEKLTLMDFEQKMEQKERGLSSRYGSISQIQRERDTVSCSEGVSGGDATAGKGNSFRLGFEDDFSTASAPPDLTERRERGERGGGSKKEEFDKYAVFRELSLEDASGFSIIGNLGSSGNKASNFSINSEDDDLSRTMDKTLTNNMDMDSSSERTIQADDGDGTGEGGSNNKNKDISVSFATGMANTMDDITDANLSDDDGKFAFDDEEDISPSSNFNTKPGEWATFESNFDDQFASASLVKAGDADGNGSPWDSEDGGENSQKTPPAPAPIQTQPQPQPSSSILDKFDFEPFQKPPQPSSTNYSLTEPVVTNPTLPPVPERRRPSKENGGVLQQQPQPITSSNNQPLSPDLLRSPVSQFHRQSSGSSKHSGKSIEEPSIGGAGGRGSDYSESGSRPRHRRGSNDEDAGRWERDRDREPYGRRRDSRENYGRSDSRESYASIPRGKYRDGRESEEEYVPSNNSKSRRGRNNARPSSSKRSSEREGEPDDDREEEEDTRSYASYHSNYSSSGQRKHRRYPQKYHHHHHHHHYSSSQRRRDRERGLPVGERSSAQAAGSGHSSLSPERYSHHESDFDDSCDEENGSRKKDNMTKCYNYAREREYAERHYHRSRPSSGAGYHHSGKRYSRESPRHSDPYYRGGDRYYRSERGRRKYDDDYEDGRDREFSEYSGEEDRYHGRHGSHRRRHRGREDYYREKEHPRHHHYYTNSPSWDSESGTEPGGEKSEKGHRSTSDRPSSAKYGSEQGSMSRHSPPHGAASSSRPSSGRRESGRKHEFPHDQVPSNGGGGHQFSRRPQSAAGAPSKMREYRFDDDFEEGDSFGKPCEPLDRLELPDFSSASDRLEELDRSSLDGKGQRQSPVKSGTLTPIDPKLSQPQSPFEDNFVLPTGPNGTGNEEALVKEDPASEVTAEKNSNSKQQSQIFFPTKFESEEGEVDDNEDNRNKNQQELHEFGGSGDGRSNHSVGFAGDGDERDNTSSPDMTYTPPASANNSLRGNFSVYSTKRLESIRSEEEKSNEDSVSESALTNNASTNNANATSSMKKSDSFNIFQAPPQDPFADDDFFK